MLKVDFTLTDIIILYIVSYLFIDFVENKR